MAVVPNGRIAITHWKVLKRLKKFILIECNLETGRTHQIRVHLAHLGFPIAGDDKYGDFALNKQLAKRGQKSGLGRMFLHARAAVVTHPVSGERLCLEAPLAMDLQKFLNTLDMEDGQ